ncbi:MAG: HEPN domain-containing protein [Bacteroidia bacterium]|nr:HEPN domain-containing protein [Bacteroidia bacterium]
MISNESRKELIDYRFSQAKETLQLARFLTDQGKLSVAVNRIYYGMFYALGALALKHSFATSKHSQLIGWFNKDFVSTHMTDARFGKILRDAFRNRTKGDYDAYVEFSPEMVNLMLVEMDQFITEISRLLSL